MIKKLSLIKYCITSLSKKQQQRNELKLNLCIPKGNSYFPPSVNIFQRIFLTYSQIVFYLKYVGKFFYLDRSEFKW